MSEVQSFENDDSANPVCLSTVWPKMSYFIRSVSDHGKCRIKLKISTVGVHSCVCWEFSIALRSVDWG